VLCNLRSSTVLVACTASLCNNPEHSTSEDLNDFQCVHSNFWLELSIQSRSTVLEFYVLELDRRNKHYLARKCWTYIRRQGVLNSCCKGPLVMLNYKSDLFCRAPFLPPHSHFGISAYYNKVLGFSFCELALPVASPSFIIDRFEGICLLLPIDHISTESLSDIALRHGTVHRPKLNDTGWDRAGMVYADHFSLYSSQSNEKYDWWDFVAHLLQ